MLLYRALFGIVALTAVTIAFFSVWGLGDGSVSMDTIAIWVVLIAAPCAVLVAAYRLMAKGGRAAAMVLLAIIAVPATLVGLFFAMVILLAPDWR